MRKCLVTELENLIKISGVKQISSIFFGGGKSQIKLILMSYQSLIFFFFLGDCDSDSCYFFS